MTTTEFEDLVQRLGALDVIEQSRLAYFDEALSEITSHGLTGELADRRQLGLAQGLERIAIDLDPGNGQHAYAEAAFLCRRSAHDQFDEDEEYILNLFMLCVDGLLGGRNAELAMLLQQMEHLDARLVPSEQTSWESQLQHRVLGAFVRLCRKGNGWQDVRDATNEIRILRALQSEFHLEEPSDATADQNIVSRLVVLFNLAKIVDLTAGFLIQGDSTDPIVQVERYWGQAHRLLQIQPDAALEFISDALRAGSLALIRGSVWYNTRQLGQRIRSFIQEIAGAHRESPVLELWPSQRAALNGNLLNPAKRAIVVEMPTSAGKTLIAEFAIIQALALDPAATVTYVVPTRALVNQVTSRLRRDFGPLGYLVEAAVPAFELDSTEDALLREDIDVLVVTPEKLDLLLKVGHPSVSAISLVVVDEAHNLAEGERGARLELLLAILRRERPASRFLLLTPFVPNGDEIANWLGDDPDGRIEVSWRPSERITAAASFKKRRKGPFELKMLTLPSATNVDMKAERTFDVGDAPLELTKSKKGIAVASAVALAERGGVLVLLRGRSYAEERAEEIARHLPEIAVKQFTVDVADFIRSELGQVHPLPGLLSRGVAFHHGGLPHDVRLLLEALIDQGEVRVTCGTTTLAQGVNFPIASVIVESLQKYVGPPKQWQQLSYAEFWNVAGRAGRAMRDRLGLVVFPTTKASEVEDVRTLLQGEADVISSALMEALESVGAAVEDFNLGFVSRNPSFAVFLQYLTHALRVAGHESTSAEIEDLLRSSFVYSRARSESRELAERLVSISRRYLDQIRGRDPGYLALADGTGFSLVSVDMIFARQTRTEMMNESFWDPTLLFSDDLRPLTSVISVLADVPELELGRRDSGTFDARSVAGIVRDWVRGESLAKIADSWFPHVENEVDRVREASHYLHSRLVGQVPWGMGAMQRLASRSSEDDSPHGHVPSLVFYGVSSKEAVELRMSGVPRVAAEGLAEQLRAQQDGRATTFGLLRDWLADRTVNEWQRALPPSAALTGAQCERVWRAISGQDQQVDTLAGQDAGQ